jgi:hypothetical protein
MKTFINGITTIYNYFTSRKRNEENENETESIKMDICSETTQFLSD